MKFKKLIAKIYEQSGSGQARNILSYVEQLRNRAKRSSPNTLPYKAKSNR